MSTQPTITDLATCLRWALEYIDEIPKDIELHGMTGFDRDYVDSVLASVQAQPSLTDEVAQLVKDIHDAIAELSPVARYPDLTEAIDRLAALSTQAAQPVCKGKNCAATDGISHSPECLVEHAAVVDAGLLDTPGNRNPEHRYAGYRGRPLPAGSNADQTLAWEEGRNATLSGYALAWRSSNESPPHQAQPEGFHYASLLQEQAIPEVGTMSAALTCPTCGSDRVIVREVTWRAVKPLEHYCYSVETQDENSKTQCLACDWDGEMKDLKESDQ